MNKQAIADALTFHRKYCEEQGFKDGHGCPFGEMGDTLEECCSSCIHLFPSLKGTDDVRTMECPCFQLTERWILRRCRNFVKEVTDG